MAGDMENTIIAKSDQLNSDDLMSGPVIITIRDTHVKDGGEQRVSIFYNDDDGKPWKPCKSMCRVMVSAWGPESKEYIGRSLKIYRDPAVTWAGMAVGGIRISHMTGLTGPLVLPLTQTKGSKKMVTIQPLYIAGETVNITDLKAKGYIIAEKGAEALKTWWMGDARPYQAKLGGGPYIDELKSITEKADAARGATSSLPPSVVSANPEDGSPV